MGFSSFNPAWSAALLLGILAAGRGGRDPAGLLLYEIASILLFIRTKDMARPACRPLEWTILIAAGFWGVSALLSLPDTTHGIALFSILAAGILNFFTFARTRDPRTSRTFFAAVIVLAAVLSLKIHLYPSAPFLPNPNLEAGFLNLGILATLAWILFGRSSGGAVFSGRVLQFGILVLVSSGLLLSFSIGALLSLGAALTALVFFGGREVRVTVLCFIGVLGGLALAFPPVIGAFAAKAGGLPSNLRRAVWSASAEAFRERPVLGWGLGRFEQAYLLHRPPVEEGIARFEKSTGFAHSEFLQAAVEGGMTGLLSFLAILAGAACLARRALRETAGPAGLPWESAAAALGGTAVLVHASIDFNLHLPLFAMISFFCLAEVLPAGGTVPGSAGKASGAALGIWAGAALVLLASNVCARASRLLYRDGRPESARSFLKAAAALNPLDADSLKELAWTAPPEERERLLRQALRFRRGDHLLHANLARHFHLLGRNGEALLSFQDALDRNPGHVFHLSEMGDVLLETGDLPEAFRRYRQAARIEPLFVLAHMRMGQILAAAGKKEEARACFRNAERISGSGLKGGSDYSRRLLRVEPG
ncbi:MAG: hypothetical protein A2902_00340 [Elusimicrobia bacterium RIFCSPLOWO2_01_FULL_64_13]|nr:MAG: hypothetical protein A2902_00340 [Elusimicrobia bacterium RIFCSPLOWO2_01_FULL_64_13]